MTSEVASRRCGYGDEDDLLRGTKKPHARFAHIASRVACVVLLGRKSVNLKGALTAKVGPADKPEGPYILRLLNQDLQSGYIASSMQLATARLTSSSAMFPYH